MHPILRRPIASGYAIALFCATVLSTTGLFIRHLSERYGIPPLVLAFWREILLAAALLAFLAVFRRKSLAVKPRDLAFLALFGLMLAVYNAAMTIAIARIGAAVATALVYSSTAFAPLIGRLLFSEPLGKAKAASIGLCLSGCVLASGALASTEGFDLVGASTGFLSGLLYALYGIFGKGAANKGIRPETSLLYSFGFASVFMLAANLSGGAPGGAAIPIDLFWLGDSVEGWGELLALAVGPTLFGFGLYNLSLTRLHPGTTNLIVSSEIIFCALAAWALLGEELSIEQCAGGVLLFAGIAILSFSEENAA
jgi:drug/metabolite transporter (DMT)-like permease